jgi:hypothetical protein
VHARAEIADLQEELQEKNNLYLNAIKERDAGVEKLNNAKESLNRFEALVTQQVDRAMTKEREAHRQAEAGRVGLEERLGLRERDEKAHLEKIRQQQVRISELERDPNLHAGSPGGQDPGERRSADQARAALDKSRQELGELQKHVNYLQDQIEDFMAENKVLRDMAGVPSNYGIDREKVKLMDREKIDDFKKLIRVLQEDNYRLEEERARLKHMMKQQSMMYSSKTPDQRYQQFNLSPDQVARVDEFVWKLVNDQAAEPADFYSLR